MVKLLLFGFGYKAKSSNSSKNNEKETNILESKIIEITEDNLAVDECLD